ncbi:MAG: sensor histidine kinase [Miltoncostaeaceae bacterium]
MSDLRRLEDEVNEQIEALERLRERLASAGGGQEPRSPVTGSSPHPDPEGEFLELLGHEIRTPLTSTIGYLDLMLAGDAGELSGEQQHCVAVARRGASRVLALITDLVVVARAEAGWLSFAPQMVDMVPIVAEAAEIADSSTDDVAVETRLPASIEVQADPDALRHLMISLVGRAVRQARPGGEVEVRLTRTPQSALTGIEHSGRPLPRAEGVMLSGIMSRDARAVADAVEGGGLELASAKAVVDAFGGRLWGEGDPHDGTRLSIEIPTGNPDRWSTHANGNGSAHE